MMDEASQTIASCAGLSGIPDIHFIDRGPRQPPARKGQAYEVARAIHEYAMNNPDRELLLVVRRTMRRHYLSAVLTIARDAGVKMAWAGNFAAWPNGTRLTVECGDDTSTGMLE